VLVLAALQRARTLFPFPILGIDTDNGGEFINESVIAYCEQAHISFTQGRPYLKNDQCFVEQKNGAIVRQVVGYDRLVGEHASRQLTELYRALRLYVNCFQPSMKLLSKQRDGKKVRYVYDPAKTPLQRLLLSGVLPAQKQQELTEVAQALDPIRLLQQLEHLQQAVFRCAVSCSPVISPMPSANTRVFSVDDCTVRTLPEVRNVADPTAGLETLYRKQERRKRVLGWRRTHRDPFEGEWEQITSWLMANPERSSGDIFRELRHRSPGRYQLLQIRTLERGMRKIRAHLLESSEEKWQEEVIRGPSPLPVSRKTLFSVFAGQKGQPLFHFYCSAFRMGTPCLVENATGRDSRTCAILFGNPCSVAGDSQGRKRWLRAPRSSRMESSSTCEMALPYRSWWTPPTGMPGSRLLRPLLFAVSMPASLRTKSEQATGVEACTGGPITRCKASCTGPIWASRKNSRSREWRRWWGCWRTRERGTRPRLLL
jgi:hypothetical protein